MTIPNYEECTFEELLDVERHIDKEEYPERYAEVRRQIERRLKGYGPSVSELTEVSPYDKYHAFWRRFFALFIDGLIFLPLWLIENWVYSSGVSGFPLYIWLVISSSAMVVYIVWMHGAYGQTLGKMVTGVKVLDVSESKLSYKQAVLREILPILLLPLNFYDAYLIVYGNIDPDTFANSLSAQLLVIVAFAVFGWFILELVTMLFNKKRRALHDFIAGSVVIKTN